MFLSFSALSKREFLGFNSNTNNRSRNSKKSSTKGYKYTENNISGPGGNFIVSTDYINQGSGGENEISMPVKLNALRYGGYSAECILDRVEPNGNIPEKEIAGQYTTSMLLYYNLIRKIKYTYIQFCF